MNRVRSKFHIPEESQKQVLPLFTIHYSLFTIHYSLKVRPACIIPRLHLIFKTAFKTEGNNFEGVQSCHNNAQSPCYALPAMKKGRSSCSSANGKDVASF